jgi:hypothetical protein
MTKVFLSPLLLSYRQEIADLASWCIKRKHIAGVQSWDRGEPVLAQADLLPPPQIEHIDLMIYEGQVDDLIMFLISEDFGLHNVHVIIKDDKGNVIESGDAFTCVDSPDIWNYFTTTSVPSGACVTVHVIATDRVWGVGIHSEDKTIP